jgi:hypothetical protein
MKPDMRTLLPKLRGIGSGLQDPPGLAEAVSVGAAMADDHDGPLVSAVQAAATGGDIASPCAVLRRAEARMGLCCAGTPRRRERVARARLDLSAGPA